MPGQSGSAIIESKYGELSVIGIHKGAISTKINGNYYFLNTGKLLNKDILKLLKN